MESFTISNYETERAIEDYNQDLLFLGEYDYLNEQLYLELLMMEMEQRKARLELIEEITPEQNKLLSS